MALKGKRQRLKRALRRTAPELARALGGPLAGAAVELVGRALVGREERDEAVLAEALMTAAPEELVRLRQAELDFRRSLLDAAAEAERIAAADRADARGRQRALADSLPGVLAITVVAGFFAVVAVMLNTDVPAGAETEFSIMLGALAAMAASVMNYYFGSSAGSREKTWLMERRAAPASAFTVADSGE